MTSPDTIVPTSSAAALAGIRVVDFGHYIAGPMAAMLLGDFGADVIHVDPPDGPRFDTPANATWNRNKRSIALDLKNPHDLEIARKLIDRADVVIENFRPGVMDRLGLGPCVMTLRNSRLVYLSLPGFASDDPRAGMRAWEGVLGAATGCYSTNPILKLERPVYNSLPFPSVFGAHWGALAVAVALNERERSGKGQIIEAPLFAATFTAFSGKAMKVHGKPEPKPLSTWRHARCKDARWFLYVPRDMHPILMREIGSEIPGGGVHAPEVYRRADEVFLTRTASEWERYCADKGIEGCPCLTTAEWLSHPLARASGIVQQYEDPYIGSFNGLGVHTRLSVTPANVHSARAKLDSHHREILAELEVHRAVPTADAGDVLRSALEGIRVLDLGIILAIPSCGRTLAEFGADVIKIDSPHRNPVPWHNDVNRAKRSILLDLKSEQGKAVFWRLLEKTDVVLENFRTGVADKLGIGYEDVRARRPDIVYCSVNAFGETEGYAERPGREVLIQALTGMQARYGGAKPAQNPINASDYVTGLGACLGVALALLHRRRTGQGQYVSNALIYGGTLLQSGLLQDYVGKHWDELGGLDVLGRGPLYRAYRTQDDWIFMAAQAHDLARCAELSDLAGMHGTELEQALETRFMTRNVAEWERVLSQAAIPSQRVYLRFEDLMRDPVVIGQGLSLTRPHEGQGLVTTTGPGIRLSRTPISPRRPAPMPGTDAESVLGEIGMAQDLERLVEQGVVVTSGVYPGGAS